MKKWIKKINIFMCCLLLCFCSVVAKPKEVEALIGVDDLALATIGLMGLSLLGIGITENINDNYDTYKKVALNTYNSMCEFVGQSWEDMCLSAYNTGQFALTQLNNVKSNIQDWYNSFLLSQSPITVNSVSDMTANVKFISSLNDLPINQTLLNNSYVKESIISNIAMINDSSNEFVCFTDSSGSFFYIFYKPINDYDFVISPYNANNFSSNTYYCSTFKLSSKSRSWPYYYRFYDYGNKYIEKGPYTTSSDYYSSHKISSYTNYFYTNSKSIITAYNYYLDELYFQFNGKKWIGNTGLELGLPSSGQNPLDGFAKLNDMVKGLDGVLDLDPISIGALNGTFDITDTTITNYGTISTAVLDLSNVHDDTYTFPLTGSLENTLDDTHTMVFNPTLDNDITNVGDITVTYPQNPSIPTLKDVDKIENIDDLKFDWTTVFPFCIPFDFIKFLKVLCSDPITPEVNWNYDLVGFKGTLNLSLKDYNDVASLLRKMETFSFILFLIFKTRDLIRG